eukprot:5645886-Pleurochrysis_carterae.AAC.1
MRLMRDYVGRKAAGEREPSCRLISGVALGAQRHWTSLSALFFFGLRPSPRSCVRSVASASAHQSPLRSAPRPLPIAGALRRVCKLRAAGGAARQAGRCARRRARGARRAAVRGARGTLPNA